MQSVLRHCVDAFRSVRRRRPPFSSARRARTRCLLLIAGVGASGCIAPAYHNSRLELADPTAGYRFDALFPETEGDGDALFVCLTFSGGGLRAAALSYGVMQELAATLVRVGDDASAPRRLLDETDVISSVSGGSFTSAAFGTWGDAMFDGRYEQRVLRRDLEGGLIGHMLAPRNFFLLPFILLDTVDVAADYYDRRVFEEVRYRDLLERGSRPYLVINATNLALGRGFEFTQADFDVLGSDLGALPLGYAVAASSAFPIVFSPMRLRYFPQAEGCDVLSELVNSPEARLADARRQAWAKSITRFRATPDGVRCELDEFDHRFCYVVDGGLCDNLGLTHVIQEYQHGYIRRRIQEGRIRRLLIIVVDAGHRPKEAIERQAASPGLLTIGYKTAVTGIENHNETLVRMTRLLVSGSAEVREAYARCLEEFQGACPDVAPPAEFLLPPTDAYVAHVHFQAIEDDLQRERCLNMPTRLSLPPWDVEELIRVGREVLVRDPEFQRFLKDAGV